MTDLFIKYNYSVNIINDDIKNVYLDYAFFDLVTDFMEINM